MEYPGCLPSTTKSSTWPSLVWPMALRGDMPQPAEPLDRLYAVIDQHGLELDGVPEIVFLFIGADIKGIVFVKADDLVVPQLQSESFSPSLIRRPWTVPPLPGPPGS